MCPRTRPLGCAGETAAFAAAVIIAAFKKDAESALVFAGAAALAAIKVCTSQMCEHQTVSL